MILFLSGEHFFFLLINYDLKKFLMKEKQQYDSTRMYTVSQTPSMHAEPIGRRGHVNTGYFMMMHLKTGSMHCE